MGLSNAVKQKSVIRYHISILDERCELALSIGHVETVIKILFDINCVRIIFSKFLAIKLYNNL